MPETLEGDLPALAEGGMRSRVSAQVEAPARRQFIIAAMLFLAFAVIAITVPGVRWRLQVVYLDLTGRIPDLGLTDLPQLLMPGARQPQIARLVVTHNPYVVFFVLLFLLADIAAGV